MANLFYYDKSITSSWYYMSANNMDMQITSIWVNLGAAVTKGTPTGQVCSPPPLHTSLPQCIKMHKLLFDCQRAPRPSLLGKFKCVYENHSYFTHLKNCPIINHHKACVCLKNITVYKVAASLFSLIGMLLMHVFVAL